MKQGGKILSEVMDELLDQVKPGAILADLDKLAETEIVRYGARPSFKRVKDYRWSICSCVNDVVVHGIPKDYTLKIDDVVGIDCGVYYRGFHTDAAWTVRVKETKEGKDEIDLFLDVGKEALSQAIRKVRIGNYIHDISSVIQREVEKSGYSVVRSLVGHGVGRNLHEDPEIPGFVKGARGKTPRITEGMVLAIEIIYNMGNPEVIYQGNDGWTIVTKDGKISGLFEATVASTSHGCLVLTKTYGASGHV
jgi:methionyl aminopeptidase